MGALGIAAADIGIEGFDAMDQAGIEQELERPVHRGRRRPAAPGAEPVEDVVGADRTVTPPHHLEHPAAQRGQPRPALLAHHRRRRQRVIDAGIVVVIVGAEGGEDVVIGHGSAAALTGVYAML